MTPPVSLFKPSLKAFAILSFILTLLISFLLFLPKTSQAQTQSVPLVTSNELPVMIDLQNPQVTEGKINANLHFKNPNQSGINPTYFVAKLLGQDVVEVKYFNGKPLTTVYPGQLIAVQTSPNFDISPNQEKDIPFAQNFSTRLYTSKYKVQITVFTTNDKLVGSKTFELDLNGSGTLLQLKNCKIVVDGVEYDPTLGPNVAPKGKVFGKCSVTNSTSSILTGFPTSDYAVNSVTPSGNQVSSATEQSSISINSKSTQTITLSLPSLEKPQVYEALAYLKDNQGKELSQKVAFRWVVAGESANIRSINLDKNTYKKGETAKVTVGADPSMDLYWQKGGPTNTDPLNASSSAFVHPKYQGTPLKNPVISVSIKDGKTGVDCGSSDYKVPFDPNQNTWPDQTIDVPIAADCQDPVVSATVKNEAGSDLATKEAKFLSFSASKANKDRNMKIIWILIGILLLAVVGGATYWFMRKRKRVPPPVTALLLLLTLAMWFANGKVNLNDGIFSTLITPVCANQAISISYQGIKGYRPGSCPGPDWLHQGQYEENGQCVLDMVSGHDSTTYTSLDTSAEIASVGGGGVSAHISGQFNGYGCGNSQVGLIIRAFINGSQNGVSINGGPSKIVFPNIAGNGGGGGTPFDTSITIASSTLKCGPLDVRIEVVPFIQHAGLVASDLAEDALLTPAEVPGWNSVVYTNRANCGGGGSCWATLQKNVDVGPCVACGAACTQAADCAYAANGCVGCIGGTCQKPPPACGTPCTAPADCNGAINGCTQCTDQGGGNKVCTAPPPACGTPCNTPADCNGAINGCTSCLQNPDGSGNKICRQQPSCGTACSTPATCLDAQDGCTKCVSGNCATCPPGMIYDPTQMKCACPNPGETNPHGVCDGDKCTSVNNCGVTECTTDKQCFAEEMCKCDGFEATQLEYPSAKPFEFEAFAKVEGADITKATVEGIQFKMSESDKSNPNVGTIIAQSPMYTPDLVSSTPQKARFGAKWSLTPPQIKADKTYRVFADIKCVPKKKRQLSNAANPNQYQSKLLGVKSANAQESSPKPSPTPDYLQLKTLNLVKKGQTDKCRFLFFEYNQAF